MTTYRIRSGKLETTTQAKKSKDAVKQALNDWGQDCQSRRLGRTISVQGQEENEERHFCTVTMLKDCAIPHFCDDNSCEFCDRNFCVVKNTG